MKRLLTIIAIAFSLSASAEIKTDSINHVNYVDIAPVRLMSDTATRMSVPAYTDNNENQAVAYVVLYNSNGDKLTSFNVIIANDYYTEWNGNDPESLYEIIADIKKFTLK